MKITTNTMSPEAARLAVRNYFTNFLPEGAIQEDGGSHVFPVVDENGNVVRFAWVRVGLKDASYSAADAEAAGLAYAEKQSRKSAPTEKAVDAEADRAHMLADPMAAQIRAAFKGTNESNTLNAVQVAATVGAAVAVTRVYLTALVENGELVKVKGKPGQQNAFYTK